MPNFLDIVKTDNAADESAIRRMVLDTITPTEAVGLCREYGAERVARAIMASVKARMSDTRDPAYVPGVWLNSTTPDPVGLLRYKAAERSKRRWRLKSVSGWKPGGSPRIAGSLEMLPAA